VPDAAKLATGAPSAAASVKVAISLVLFIIVLSNGSP
jgi:hypothetical protein